MFEFLQDTKEEQQWKLKKKLLRELGIIVDNRHVGTILYNQLIGNENCRKCNPQLFGMIKQIFGKLKLAIPITITGFLDTIQFPIGKDECNTYATDLADLILRVNSSVGSFDKFEIGMSKDGKEFMSISSKQESSISRVINDSYQYETINGGNYHWTYSSKTQKISIRISEYKAIAINDFQQLSANLLNANLDFKRILEILRKYSKSNNKKVEIRLEENQNDLYETYSIKKMVIVDSGKTMEYYMNESNFSFSYSLKDGEEWEFIKNIPIIDQTTKIKEKYNVRLHYNKRTGFLFEILATISNDTRESINDDFGISELLEKVEHKIERHLDGNKQSETTFNIKTSTYSIEFYCGNKWKYETNNSRITDSEGNMKYSINYNNKTGWRVFIRRMVSNEENKGNSEIVALKIRAQQIINSIK